jgi:hypothetical protein
MKVIREHLDDTLHKILLCDNVFAAHNLFEDARKDGLQRLSASSFLIGQKEDKLALAKRRGQTYRLVNVQINIVQLTETDKVGANENLQLLALHLSLFTFLGVALMLETDPKFVHLDKVG